MGKPAKCAEVAEMFDGAPSPPATWFRSDNVAGACPEIVEALIEANRGSAPAYGADPITDALDAKFGAVFEHDVAVFPVATGTAANALALSLAPPRTNVFCHAAAHILLDEAGAVEFACDVRLTGMAGGGGKITAQGLERALSCRRSSGSLPDAAVSIAQASELGTLYSLEETAAIAVVAHRHGMLVHMDGARFANALVALGCSPAEASWRSGVDVLSFGATKNGALAAEAVLVFDRARAASLATVRKRAGHTLSKMRFFSAQLAAILDNDLWLRNAASANARAAELAQALEHVHGARLMAPAETNQLFVTFSEPCLTALAAAGIAVNPWGGPGSQVTRLVTAFDTSPQDIAQFAYALRAATGPEKENM